MNALWRHRVAAPRFTPLLGVLIGAAGGGIYWLGAQIWPTNIAVVLSMLCTALLTAGADAGAGGPSGAARTSEAGLAAVVLAVLVKYGALMALSAASVPFALPANLALGLIMIAGQSCGRALAVSAKPASHAELAVALVLGFAPAALIGMQGLIGLVAAILARMAWVASLRRHRRAAAPAQFGRIRELTEVCFYLGTLAARAYI